MQGVDRDFRGAVEANFGGAGAGAAMGVALEGAVGPAPGVHEAGDGEVVENGAPAGQADLAAMGVSGKVEVDAGGLGFVVVVAGVAEENERSVERVEGLVVEGGHEVVGLVAGGVVYAEEEDVGVARNSAGLVDEDGDVEGFERGDHVEGIVISENGDDGFGKVGADGGDAVDRGTDVAGQGKAIVAGDNGGAGTSGGFREEAKAVREDLGQGVVGDEMQVAEVEEGQRLAQAGEGPALVFDGEVERVLESAFVEAEAFEPEAEEVGVFGKFAPEEEVDDEAQRIVVPVVEGFASLDNGGTKAGDPVVAVGIHRGSEGKGRGDGSGCMAGLSNRFSRGRRACKRS